MKSTILVVEDDEKISFLLNFLLSREGYQVLRADDGEAASELIKSSAPPALALLDVMLPHKDGHVLLAEIRAKPAWNDVPVLFLTAKAQSFDVKKGLESGANDYIIKPFEPVELLARIKRFIKPCSET